jgi:hypothetical protein
MTPLFTTSPIGVDGRGSTWHHPPRLPLTTTCIRQLLIGPMSADSSHPPYQRREVSRSSCRHRPPDPVTPLQIHESEYNSHDANWTSGAEKGSDRLTECTVRLNAQSAVYREKCSYDGPQNGNKERLRLSPAHVSCGKVAGLAAGRSHSLGRSFVDLLTTSSLFNNDNYIVRFVFAHRLFSQYIYIRLIQVFERTSWQLVLRVHFSAPAYHYHYAAITKSWQPTSETSRRGVLTALTASSQRKFQIFMELSGPRYDIDCR